VFREEDEKLFKVDDPTTASKVSAGKRVPKAKSGTEKSNGSADSMRAKNK
jgi:hypothetical protein